MWKWMKYLYLALRLATLWENLKAVPAKAPETNAASYAPAAEAMLTDEGVLRWMGRLSDEEQAKFAEGLPLFIWGLDNMTE